MVPLPVVKADAPDMAMSLPEATATSPLRATLPVPVVKVPEPATTRLPLTVFVPELVPKVPVLPEASKLPAESVRCSCTVSVGTVEVGKKSWFMPLAESQ